MLDAWRSVCAGEGSRVMLLLADSGIGKTRLVSEFYGSIAAVGTYWPPSLQPTGASLEVNPTYPSGCVPTGEIPWLWWGLRWPAQDRRNEVYAERCALAEWQGKLDCHIKPMLSKRTRKQAMKDAGKILAGMALNFVPFGTIPSMAKDLVELGIVIKNYAHPNNSEAERWPEELAHERAVAERATSFLQSFLDTSIKECPTVPVVLVLDDAQWADPTTLGFVRDLIGKSVHGNWPLLVLTTHWEAEWERAKTHCATASCNEGTPATFAEVLHSLEAEMPGWHDRCSILHLEPLRRTEIGSLLDARLPVIGKEDREWILQRCDGNPLVLEEFLCICYDSPHWFTSGNPSTGAIAADWQDDFRNSTTDADRRAKTRLAQLTRTDPAVIEFLKLGACQGMFFFDSLVSAVAGRLQIQLGDHAATAAATPHCITSHVAQGLGRSEFRHFLYYQHSRNLIGIRHLAMIRKAFLEVLADWWRANRFRDTVEAVDFCELAYRLLDDMAGKSPITNELSLSLQCQLAEILHYGGGRLVERGATVAAEKLYRRALNMYEHTLGSEHRDTLGCASSLAVVLWQNGATAPAEKLCRQVLDVQERTLGVGAMDTLDSVGNLANFVSERGEFDAAKKLYCRALNAYEQMLGPEHLKTLGILNNLANLVNVRGDSGAALKMYQRVLTARERILGTEHADTLSSIHNLASVLFECRDYESAEILYRRSLSIRERILGVEHFETMRNVNNLVSLLCARRDYEGAEKILRDTLVKCEKTLAADHPVILDCINSLGNFLRDRREYAEAEKLYRMVFDVRMRLFGTDHVAAQRSACLLARLAYVRKDYATAETLLRCALEKFEAVMDPDSQEMLNAVSNLAKVMCARKDYAEAERFYRRVFEARERTLGAEHPSRLVSVIDLSKVLDSMKRHEEAEELLQRHAVLSIQNRRVLCYRWACSACLAGHLNKAKGLIAEMIRENPRALNHAVGDSDLAAIRDDLILLQQTGGV